MSRTFSMKNGSVDSLKYWCRCGCRPNSLNQRCTVLFETPLCEAIARTLQCVRADGLVCRASLMTVATRSSS